MHLTCPNPTPHCLFNAFLCGSHGLIDGRLDFIVQLGQRATRFLLLASCFLFLATTSSMTKSHLYPHGSHPSPTAFLSITHLVKVQIILTCLSQDAFCTEWLRSFYSNASNKNSYRQLEIISFCFKAKRRLTLRLTF